MPTSHRDSLENRDSRRMPSFGKERTKDVGDCGAGPEQDTENVVRDYASVEKWEKNLRATQQEGSHAQY